jgi:hypothetical protein
MDPDQQFGQMPTKELLKFWKKQFLEFQECDYHARCRWCREQQAFCDCHLRMAQELLGRRHLKSYYQEPAFTDRPNDDVTTTTSGGKAD